MIRLSSARRRAVSLLLCAAAIVGCAERQTVRQGPSAPPEVGPAVEATQAFRLTSGLYRMTTRGPRGVDTGEIRLVHKGNAVRVIDTDDTEWPGDGRVDGNAFTPCASDEHGEVRMDGELRSDDVMEGTIILTPAGDGPVRKMSFKTEKIGSADAPWSRPPSSVAP